MNNTDVAHPVHDCKWQNIPDELKALPQWCISPGTAMSKAPYTVQGGLANIKKPNTWSDFNTVCQEAANRGWRIGFVFTASDPFTCIDLDVVDEATQIEKCRPVNPSEWTSQEKFERFNSIIKEFDSYTELSRSGKGCHIIVKGNIGAGRKRDGVEVYSQDRFIIFTGSVVRSRPIAERQELLSNMVTQMRPVTKPIILDEVEPEDDDWYILDQASNASNGDKFWKLWKGDWQGFPSQSEADFALINFLAFYSRSNSQCRRMFRDSILGKREKATKNDVHIDRCLKTIRQEQQEQEQIDLSAIQKSAKVVQQIKNNACIKETIMTTHPRELQWPPGAAGEIAKFVYNSAPRPVKEVAIVASLGLLAGICGKAWNISNTGLNLYIVLIARSATGKEAMHTGISTIVKTCIKESPTFTNFVDFTEYASGPALIKACAVNPSFVNVSGEWGRRMKRIAQTDSALDSPLQTLRTQMTNLYHKSGRDSIVGGLGYSDKDKNVSFMGSVAYSMIGETTPGTFYDSLTNSMMEDGFLSRFIAVEYNGDRPSENKRRTNVPDQALATWLSNIANQATKYILDGAVDVQCTYEAESLFESFSLECDYNVNRTQDESQRQMWNRAALKVMRIAALLAVADNYLNPVVNRQHAEWALYLIRHDLTVTSGRVESGDIGMSDDARQKKLIALIKDYIVNGASKSFNFSEQMKKDGIVPKAFLQVRTARNSAFYNHSLGSNKALADSLKTMVSVGMLVELSKAEAATKYSYHGEAYRIISLPG